MKIQTSNAPTGRRHMIQNSALPDSNPKSDEFRAGGRESVFLSVNPSPLVVAMLALLAILVSGTSAFAGYGKQCDLWIQNGDSVEATITIYNVTCTPTKAPPTWLPDSPEDTDTCIGGLLKKSAAATSQIPANAPASSNPPGNSSPPANSNQRELEVGMCRTFRSVWNDRGSGADQDGAFYRPLLPAGYVAVGNHEKPTARASANQFK